MVFQQKLCQTYLVTETDNLANLTDGLLGACSRSFSTLARYLQEILLIALELNDTLTNRRAESIDIRS